jgi:hypothetical protein
MLSHRPTIRFLLLAGWLLTAPVSAEEPVFLRGYEVTPQHVVFGQIDSLRGDVAVLNLGFAHGLRSGESLLVIRRVDEEVLPISGLTVLVTEADHSRAQVEGPFHVQPGDYVLIHASRLKIWGGMPRLDRLAGERIVRRRNATGYSTLDTSADLIEEVARDDDNQDRQYQGVKAETMILEANTKVGPTRSEIGAVIPLPVLVPNQTTDEAAQARAELDPTIQAFSYFVELSKSRNTLIPRMSNERLERLRPIGNQEIVDEANAPLYREIMLAWVSKAILPR